VWPRLSIIFTAHYSISHCLHFPNFMKQSAINLSPYSSSHPPLSPPSLTHRQPSTHPLPYPPMSSQHTDRLMSTHGHGPSTSATSSPPPAKRRRREPSPQDNITHTRKPPKSHPRGRPGRRGKRKPETKALKLEKYVDSGGPHRASMVIDNLTSK
jgi:hypothetical protein